MSVLAVIDKMKRIQCSLLEFLEGETDDEEKYENFVKLITDVKIREDQHTFKLLLRLIARIGNNHQRVKNLISKIEQILVYLKKDIQESFTNSEIFNFFENNKRILLFLIQEKIMIVDENFVLDLSRVMFFLGRYMEYFLPEIKPFLTDEFIEKHFNTRFSSINADLIEKVKKEEISKEFYEKRKKGENDDKLCELIRENNAKDFGVYVNRRNVPLDSEIASSIFETNQILANSNTKLIEYAAFFGSNDIVKYIQINGEIELTSDIWYYVVHSRNAELIKDLEDHHVSPPGNNYEIILRESIKCHHNDVSNYIINYLMKEEDLQDNIENSYDGNLYRYAFEYDNYCFFPENIKYKNMFFYLCFYDYYILVKFYLEHENVDINAKNILNIKFLNDILK